MEDSAYVSCVDPDLTLSYIDEKLENVLGHFQKDFEGGVSADNLGAKFGGYGSFLSMYQRSSLCSDPKTPPEVQSNVGVKSICSASTAVPEVSISGSASKIGTRDNKQKSDTKISCSAPSNHKTLRFHIKVGSSALSSLKNVSTYGKEGLNLPPSALRVNCLSKIEDDLLNGICDSPTKLVMAMVSFPLQKDQLLSPLSDDLIQLGKKEKIVKDARNGSDSQKHAGKFSIEKKEKLKDRVNDMPRSNKLDRIHIVSNTEKEADKDSCVELVSKTMKLPLLSCLSPSYIHPAKEIDKVSDSNVESTSRGTNYTDLDSALLGAKPELENDVAGFSDRSIKETESINTRKGVYLEKGEPLNSLESESKREKAPNIEHVDYSSVVKGIQRKIRDEEQNFESELPNAQKWQKGSSSIVAMSPLRGKEAAINIIKRNVPNKSQEDIGGCEQVYKGFVGNKAMITQASGKNVKDIGKASSHGKRDDRKRKLKENKESGDCMRLREAAVTDSSGEDVRMKKRLKGSSCDERGLPFSSETCDKDKRRSQESGSASDLPFRAPSPSLCKDLGSEMIKNSFPEARSSLVESVDIAKASSHGKRDDRKRKLKENKESGDRMRLREAAVTDSSGEDVRMKKMLKGSSCDERELPFSSETCDKDKRLSQESGRDSASDLPFRAPSPSLCKDLGSEMIKNSFPEARSLLVESVAPSVLDSHELKSGRISKSDDYHDADCNAGDTLKRCEDDEPYSTIDKPGTTKIAAENSKDRDRAYYGNCSVENFEPKKSGRYSGENCIEGDFQQKSREEGSSAPLKDNNWSTSNEVQDFSTAVKIETKESRSKKRPAKKVSMEGNKEDSRKYQDPNTKLDRGGSHFSSPQKSYTAKTSNGKSNHLEITSEKLKKRSADTDHVEVLGHGSELSNMKKQILQNDNHIVTHNDGLQNQKQNGSRHKGHVGLSPLKKESTSQAVSNSIKEATDLKHMADRLTNAGSNHESTGLYFQAALKFLHGASLLESSGTDNATDKSGTRSRHIYGSTAKLCEFCAHEYEKKKDMGAAALAYKCMEVAYLRIIYASHGNIRRCRYELQAALQVSSSGDSPSFASDGENTNHTVATKKVALSNTLRSSPSVTGNHIISSGNSSLSQLLAFSQNISCAMDASRKAQIAFAAAKGKSFNTKYSSDGITSIKRALDFNFEDMEKLLHVVRLAMESINR